MWNSAYCFKVTVHQILAELCPFENFGKFFGQMFTSVSRCPEAISQPCQGHGFEPWVSCPLHIAYTPRRIFFKLCSYVCLSEMMCRNYNNHSDTRSRSQFNVTGLSLEFLVCSVFPIQVEGLSLNFGHMFTIMRRCAESITQACRLEVKVTVQSHGLEPWISCRSVSPLPLGGFSLNVGQMFTSVGQCAEPITQPCRLNVKVTVEGHEFEPWIWCQLHISLPLEECSLNFDQMFASVRWCAEPITQLCWLKVKVTIEGHQFEPWILSLLHCHSDCLVKFGSNIRFSEMMCKPITQRCRLKVKVTIEGHPSLSCSLHISWTVWKIFMKLWSNVCVSEAMCRTHNSSMPTRSRSQ